MRALFEAIRGNSSINMLDLDENNLGKKHARATALILADPKLRECRLNDNDLRAAAAVAKGRTVADGVGAMVVPGSGLVKEQAESEGLDVIFTDAGFEWRDAGCSMCLAMNADKLEPGERCASTSNRNFEGRQGRGGRTHLVGPEMAAAAAITGKLTDVRKLGED